MKPQSGQAKSKRREKEVAKFLWPEFNPDKIRCRTEGKRGWDLEGPGREGSIILIEHSAKAERTEGRIRGHVMRKAAQLEAAIENQFVPEADTLPVVIWTPAHIMVRHSRCFIRVGSEWMCMWLDEFKRRYIDGFRQPQTPDTGLGAIIGKWPGDETDDEIATALQEID